MARHATLAPTSGRSMQYRVTAVSGEFVEVEA
ncbi:MAG: hypothetical protein ACI9MC_004089, partial [Kiritimatiellia bacterium]